ncbi:DUF1292 domain-containing protein [Paenibacillus urinalis]|uniref:UPF0473 protein PUW23_19890 n=1 Tax=Paenibacillus urinalis TaxID=521520 RepID=A0AAX3MXC2_9BACL|nr:MULTISPECIES: DUF1292 domain-containing protein [Paenibacillus]WDH81751.1 DUF1292 domain-containing protein [Paenibacillus urinalis]WDH97801.1 DUF1292 domain-containing protein [Paenibacillus urinalis]WDI01478.1 DUF1292 domain-containing protein [Paenibacillus urinalis]GAK42262.1 hypothetical protein TCA2_4754 [Paenibacillus sp. TCA20]
MTDNRLGMDEDREIIYITDEEGNDEEFEVIMTFDVDGSDAKYMMVVPVEAEEDEDESEVYAFRYEEDGDDIKLFTIQDEAEWAIVEETFNTLVAAEEDEENV